MNQIVTLLIFSFLFIAPANAQTWAQQQEAYSKSHNLEVELFQQREEMERMQREHDSAMQEQHRETEMQNLRMERERKQQSLIDSMRLE